MNRLRLCRGTFSYCLGILILIALAVALPAGSLFAQLTKDDITALKAQGQREGWTFEVGENTATVRTLEQLTGFKMPAVLPEGVESANLPATTDAQMPPSFDWRVEKGLPPIRNQGSCGSCWAFATVGALECAIKIRDNKVVDLSEQYLVSCNHEGWGCSGGWWAHHYHQSTPDDCGGVGAVLEPNFTYAAGDIPCGCPYTHSYTIDRWGYIGQPYTVASVSQLKQAIMTYGPVSVAVSVNSAFQAYRSGVFNSSSSGDINHAVVLVGWDDTQGESGVWIMRNSWGVGWGESGYMRIAYGCSRIGYNSTFIEYRGALWFAAQTTLAKAPADITFTPQTSLSVTDWNWAFGDGQTSTSPNPTHTYAQPGCYDVSLTVQTPTGPVATSIKNCVLVHADSLATSSVEGWVGKPARVDVALHNYLPLTDLVIPLQWQSPAGLRLDSVSTAGLRTSYMDKQQALQWFATGRVAYELACSDLQPDLPAGNGPILSLYFSVPTTASGTTSPVTIEGYSTAFGTYPIKLTTAAGSYTPDVKAGSIRVCLSGDVNASGTGPDLSDLSFLIAYLEGTTSELPNPPAANVNGTGIVDVADLSTLISYLLTGEPPLLGGI